MSLLTQAIVAEKYGLRLTMAQLADVMQLAKQTIYNMVATDSLPVKTYKDGAHRFAAYQDVALYLDECRERAT